MAGCHAQYQQSEIAKKKQHDAVFFVKQERQKSRRGGEDTPNAPRASADSGSVVGTPAKTCMAGCHAQYQQSEIAKKKQHDAVFFVKQERQKSRRGGEDTPNAPPPWRQVFNLPNAAPSPTRCNLVATFESTASVTPNRIGTMLCFS
jgi:hypothetical protein